MPDAKTPAPDSAPDSVVHLVERFALHRDQYQQAGYNETQLRREFLDPFFKALGWDVDNRQGHHEAYKEVIHEDAIRVEESIRAPDYCFRVGGLRKFFVEAKKPSVDIRDDVSPAFQLRRYAWSAKLPLSILTDFEELAVYDCRVKPDKKDKASTARVMYLKFDEYVDRWGELADIFSKEAILRGAFDKYAASHKKKRGTAEVDDAFLEEIESWRKDLAQNLALRNKALSQRELNFAVQRIIDRIIFLRMCEGRGIERHGQLQSLTNGKALYRRLCELFQRADEKFNSGLFHFQKEKDREPPDELTPSLAVDDKVLKDILTHLYYPESPYEFAVLPSDILGQVYEQFLGKVIRLTKGHRAVIEDKPEVKKAGGVYYTPTYIVDYIVENTLGKLLGNAAPVRSDRLQPVESESDVARSDRLQPVGSESEVARSDRLQPVGSESEASKPKPDESGHYKPGLSAAQADKLRVLDPACGSGSFLIVAYQYLLDWYREHYAQSDSAKWSKGRKPRIYQGPDGSWRLTTGERKRILLGNIHGVDIDFQAVEVTKLSLLLKVLEGESEESLGRQFKLFHKERALPDLASNIKCGNSLIGPEFYDNQQLELFDDEEKYRINVFDWKTEFPKIMKRGGFDVVIGNPPYIRIQAMKEWAPAEVEFYKTSYAAAAYGNYDIYVVFAERGLSLLNEGGTLGFILPHKFFTAKYGSALRALLGSGRHVSNIVHFGHGQVFQSATTYTCLLFLTQKRSANLNVCHVSDIEAWRATGDCSQGDVDPKTLGDEEWRFILGTEGHLLTRLTTMGTPLGEIAHLFVGLQTDADDVFIVDEIGRDGDTLICRSKYTGKDHEFEASHLKRLLKGSLNIRRYQLDNVTKRVIFPYMTVGGRSELIEPNRYQSDFPKTWEYLNDCRERLSRRNKGKMGDSWYGYVYKKNHLRFETPKLVVPSIATGSCFAADLQGDCYFVGSGGGGGGGYGITLNEPTSLSSTYLLGVLNCRLVSWFLRLTSTPFRGGYIALNRQYIQGIPVIVPDDPKGPSKATREIERLAKEMMRLFAQRATAKTSHEQTALQRQIDATDRRIDALVYQLYGLSDEEIRIVEEATGAE